MATRGVAMTIPFTAWDTSANAPKTGDQANFTLRWVKDGTASTLTTATVTQIDSTNAPGEYTIGISATEADCNIGKLVGKSSTANVVIIPVQIQFERLPDAAPTAAGGVLDTTRINGVSASSVTAINANIGTTQPINFTGTSGSALVKTDVIDIAGTGITDTGGRVAGGFSTFFNVASPVTTLLTVASTTNITSASGVTVSALGAGVITAASIAADAITDAKVASDVTIASVTGSVGSVAGNVSGNVAGSVGSVATGVTLADGAHAGTSATLTLKSITVSNSTGNAVTLSSTGSNGHGMYVTGNGTGDGAHWVGGATGHGMNAQGGSTSGDGIHCAAAGIGDGFEAAGAGGGVDIRGDITGGIIGDITGNLSGNVGGNVSGSTQSIVDGVTFTGTITTLDALNTSLNNSHGTGSWATATGFAVAGDAMALTSGERTTLAGVIWGTATTAITTAGSIGKRLVDLFSGITYMSKWLGALAGKTADSGTLAEINATTAGAGYNNTTDSQEAIRDRGDSAWTGGAGGGTTTLVVAPIKAIVPTQTIPSSGTQEFFQYGPLPGGPITVLDANLDPIDLSGKNLKLVMTCNRDTAIAFKLVSGVGGQLTVGGTDSNQVTVDGDSTYTQTAGDFTWNLRDADTDFGYAWGTWRILPMANDVPA